MARWQTHVIWNDIGSVVKCSASGGVERRTGQPLWLPYSQQTKLAYLEFRNPSTVFAVKVGVAGILLRLRYGYWDTYGPRPAAIARSGFTASTGFRGKPVRTGETALGA